LGSLALLQARGRRVHCLLVGDGPERDALAAQAEAQQLSVVFYGACYDEPTLARLFMLANACVSPGWIGLTAIHALTYGTPIITHDNANEQGPEWEAVTDGATGALFRQHDVADLAAKIGAWTADAQFTPQVRERCWQVIARYYNPEAQMAVLRRALAGLPAEDTAWQRWAGAR
ncbi:MAG: glycosyltransferase, partial [Armatimonadetes bacterium]|nr:glycosyltransferase [Armatimonadota bacterium]